MNIFYNQVTDVCGSAAVREKIMSRTEKSNKIVVFVGPYRDRSVVRFEE